MAKKSKPKTYRRWLECGRQVKRGEKATGRSEAGEPTFTASQTKLFERGIPDGFTPLFSEDDPRYCCHFVR